MARRNDWEEATRGLFVCGGLNLFQDLHFSSFYLRASLSSRTMPDYPGYSVIVAFYENGTEKYYVPLREAEVTSDWIVKRAKEDVQWLPEILAEIERRSRSLSEVFDGTDDFSDGDAEDLIALHERHATYHNALYTVARLPEALDRGRPWFSNYLRSHLASAGVPPKDLHTTFNELTHPEKSSVVAEEQDEFSTIVKRCRDDRVSFAGVPNPLMALGAELRRDLDAHRNTWAYLRYHGFRNRTLPSDSDWAQRLLSELDSTPRETANRGCSRSRTVPALDSAHEGLFRVYSEVGRVKIARRFAQLRNFYFLDRLMAQTASRLGASEWDVRCCLPEEVIASLRRHRLPRNIEERRERCAVVYRPSGETVICGEEMRRLASALEVAPDTETNPNVRHGTPACVGYAIGRANTRCQFGDLSTFTDGDILVCGALDPDLLPIVRRAAAVITEQGGVASHASLVCRELGVPTVIGVSGLAEFCANGEELEVDATLGRIVRNRSAMMDTLHVPPELERDPKSVGAKAANLAAAKEAGLRVPAFTVLSWDALAALRISDRSALASRLTAIAASLGSSRNHAARWIFRSTALDEDSLGGGPATAYVSRSFDSGDVIEAIDDFIDANTTRNYRGAVMVQRFLPAAACGVAVDDTLGDGACVVEVVSGTENLVTAGRGEMTRYSFHPNRGDLEVQGASRTDFPVIELLDWLSRVRGLFGARIAVEWGLFENEFWLYQVRRLG